TNVSSTFTNIFNTVSVEVQSLSNGTNKIVTGEMRMADLHNRKFLVFTNGNTMFLWLASYRPAITNQSSFGTSDPSLLNKQVQQIPLGSTENQFQVVVTHWRHRSLPTSTGYSLSSLLLPIEA